MKLAPPPVTLDQLPVDWVALRREIIVREGLALRPGPMRATIEVKSLTTNEWCLLTLPGGAEEFQHLADRDQVLRRLQGEESP